MKQKAHNLHFEYETQNPFLYKMISIFRKIFYVELMSISFFLSGEISDKFLILFLVILSVS